MTIICICPFFIMSTTFGRAPSLSLKVLVTGMPFEARNAAVPAVEKILKPSSWKDFATDAPASLSWSLTEMKTLPEVGRPGCAAIWLLANAMPSDVSSPMTSPVERISGVSIICEPRKRTNGNTLSFTAM